MKRVDKVFRDIKNLKIQGATNVAKEGIKAYLQNPSLETKNKLIRLRPTEPALFNSLKRIEEGWTKSQILKHFEESQKKINQNLLKILKENSKVYTHCHSSTVIKALVYARKKIKFSVSATETRPLYQGRTTAEELASNNIKVNFYVDSGAFQAISNSNLILLGADAVLRDKVLNKIGSRTICEIAKINKIPLYILTDSWKFSKKEINIEYRNPAEVWKKNHKNIEIKNPAFEEIPRKDITEIISELGVLNYKQFITLSSQSS